MMMTTQNKLFTVGKPKEKYVSQGFPANEFPNLLDNLADYAKSGEEKPKTFHMGVNIKYRLTVKNAIAAHRLYYSFTGKLVEDAQGYIGQELPERYTGKPPILFTKNDYKYEPNLTDAMIFYGHPFHAAKVLESQLNALRGQILEQSSEIIKTKDGKEISDKLAFKEYELESMIESLKNAGLSRKIYYSDTQHKVVIVDQTRTIAADAERLLNGKLTTPAYTMELTEAEKKEIAEIEQKDLETAQREFNRRNQLVSLRLQGEDLGYYSYVRDIEDTDSKKGKLPIYDLNGNEWIVKKGRGKGKQLYVPKKKLTWNSNDLLDPTERAKRERQEQEDNRLVSVIDKETGTQYLTKVYFVRDSWHKWIHLFDSEGNELPSEPDSPYSIKTLWRENAEWNEADLKEIKP